VNIGVPDGSVLHVGSKRGDLVMSSKHLASGRPGHGNDDELRSDDGDFGWGDGEYRFDFCDHDDHGATHKDLILPVAPTATSGDFDMHAILDSPGPTEARPLMILVSGFSYDHQYWDVPVDGGKYSFVDAANRAGYATLNLDRLGLGASDRPPSDLTTIQQQADELHQVIQSIKSGAFSSLGFSKIVLVGHSLGSAIVQTEAGAYDDADALVLTGFRHEVNPAGAGEFAGSIHPASGQPPGYLTLDNRSFLYDVGNTSPDVLAWDASHIGTGTGAELNFAFALDPARSAKIAVPVLEVVGDHDLLFQTDPSTFAAERAFYPSSPNFEQLVVKNAGHDVTLQNNAHQTIDQIIDFVDKAVPVTHHHDLLI
jgi:pimeloyl-ACP methyl ester carboxylesterase